SFLILSFRVLPLVWVLPGASEQWQEPEVIITMISICSSKCMWTTTMKLLGVLNTHKVRDTYSSIVHGQAMARASVVWQPLWVQRSGVAHLPAINVQEVAIRLPILTLAKPTTTCRCGGGISRTPRGC